jgi:hypothetical protein
MNLAAAASPWSHLWMMKPPKELGFRIFFVLVGAVMSSTLTYGISAWIAEDLLPFLPGSEVVTGALVEKRVTYSSSKKDNHRSYQFFYEFMPRTGSSGHEPVVITHSKHVQKEYYDKIQPQDPIEIRYSRFKPKWSHPAGSGGLSPMD